MERFTKIFGAWLFVRIQIYAIQNHARQKQHKFVAFLLLKTKAKKIVTMTAAYIERASYGNSVFVQLCIHKTIAKSQILNLDICVVCVIHVM